MAQTTVFNLSAVDRIEAIVKQVHSDTQAILGALSRSTQVTEALEKLEKTVSDLITALGGGDQPSIDAATAELQQLASDLAGAVARDQPPEGE